MDKTTQLAVLNASAILTAAFIGRSTRVPESEAEVVKIFQKMNQALSAVTKK